MKRARPIDHVDPHITKRADHPKDRRLSRVDPSPVHVVSDCRIAVICRNGVIEGEPEPVGNGRTEQEGRRNRSLVPGDWFRSSVGTNPCRPDLAVLDRDLATQGGDGPDSEKMLALSDVAQSNPSARLSLPNRLSHLADLEKTR